MRSEDRRFEVDHDRNHSRASTIPEGDEEAEDHQWKYYRRNGTWRTVDESNMRAQPYDHEDYASAEEDEQSAAAAASPDDASLRSSVVSSAARRRWPPRR